MVTSLILLLTAMASIQFGATLSRSLFPLLGATGATTWRLLLAATILLLIWRPWRFSYSPQQRRGILYYGLSLGFMNLCFYLALERIPLGIAVALEFTGPLTVALISSKRPRDLFWALLATLGMGLILPLHAESQLDPVGVFMALLAGLCWAAYIILGQKTSEQNHAGRAAALGMLVAALVTLPFGLVSKGPDLWQPILLPMALMVAVFSSALPYSLEMMALKRLPSHTFSILMSLEPAIATLMGWLFLQEILAPQESVGIGLIMLASFGSAWYARASSAS